MAFAEALAEFRAAVPVAPIPVLESAELRLPPPLFIQMPTPIVSEADLNRALAQENV